MAAIRVECGVEFRNCILPLSERHVPVARKENVELLGNSRKFKSDEGAALAGVDGRL